MPARCDAVPRALPWLIVFSHLRWGFVRQRPQHLMARLARHFRVLFVEEPVRCEGAAHFDRIAAGPGIEVLCPRTPSDAAGFHDEQLAMLKPLLAAFLHDEGIADYLAWFYTPMALPMIDGLEPRAVVYDCMHELSAFKDAPRPLRERETALLARASLVFTSGPALYDAKRALHPRVHCLPSAVEAARFAPGALDAHSGEARAAERLHAAMPGPRLGFFGVIDARIDLELVATLAEREPGWQIVMAGPVATDAAALPRRPNIHWLGMQPYARLPYLLQQWDVCLMPFALNQATRCLSPTKTLEYMAGEKPVVSTALYDVVALHGDVVHIGRDAAGFVQACAAALGESGHRRNQRLGEMLASVARMSWEHSAESVHRLIAAQAAQPAQITLAGVTPSVRPRHDIAIEATPPPYRPVLEGEAKAAAAP